jgi:dienelactone hydrolase
MRASLLPLLATSGLCLLVCAGCDEQTPASQADAANGAYAGPGQGGPLGVLDSSVQAAPDAGAAPALDTGVVAPVPDASAGAPRAEAGTSLEAGTPTTDGAPPVPIEASTPDSSTTNPEAGVTDGGAPPGAHFPRTSEAVNVARKGPYAFKTYTDGLADPVYESAIMYYPDGATPPFAAIVLSPGFLAAKESYTTLGEIFASHGFAMMLTTPTSVLDFMPERGDDLVAAVARIGKENARAGSPLQGKLAADRVCLTGQSMGGGGTLHAASELGNMIRCAVPLQPYEPGTRFSRITAPTLIIAAEADTVAGVASNARVHYDSIPASTEKIFAEFRGADHFLTTNAGTLWEEQSVVMVAFYKLKLEDDQRYSVYLYGGMEPKAALSRYEYSKR